jgi:hypothetical protein
VGGVDSLDTLTRIINAIFKNDTANLVRQDTEYFRFSFMPSVVAPNFGISFFENLSSFTSISNLSLPTIDVYMFNDVGAIAGVGFPLGPYASIGISARYFLRTSLDIYKTPAQLLADLGIPGPTFMNDVYNYLFSQTGMGLGLGINVGGMLHIPLDKKNTLLNLAATIEDLGNTNFIPLTMRNAQPIHQSINFGGAVHYKLSKKNKLTLALDFRNNFESYPINKMLHAGIEYRHNLFGFRAGLYQGYPTFGLSIEAPHHTRIHFSTYAVELGNNWWEKSQRWWLLQLCIGFKPI